MTTNDETYNGWTNRETWAFMLYVQNDQGLSVSARERLELTDGDNWLIDSLADWAEMHFTRDGYTDDTGGSWPDDLADMARDIGSLWRINWSECVEALTDGE